MRFLIPQNPLVNRKKVSLFNLLDSLPPSKTNIDKNWNSSFVISPIAFRYRQKQRGENVAFTQAEQESCMVNSAPGSPDLCILSFKGAFHGRTIGALSTTHSKYIHKIDIPSFDWPIASFPQYKYPLEENVRENKAEDDRCLAEVEDLIETYNKRQKYVAGLIVEPIQSEGGDNEASPEFFQGLRRITKKHGVALLIDEVQTGGGPTGKLWAHEHFNLDSAPDVVTFSKKMQLGGYFHSTSLKPSQAYRVFNTWMGDPGKLVLLEAILNVIKRDSLLDDVNRVGAKLKSGLIQAQNDYPALLNSTRGRGTFLAINCASGELRDDIINRLRAKGTPNDSTFPSHLQLIHLMTHFIDISFNYSIQVFSWVAAETKQFDSGPH